MTSEQIRNTVIGVTSGIGLLLGGTWLFNREPDSESVERTSSTTTTNQSISISTASDVPLTFEMGTATVDIQFIKKQGQMIDKDLLDPVWLANTKALGFTRAVNFSDGSISNYAYCAVPPSVGKGYNGKVSDFPNQREFDEWGGGVLKTVFSHDFFDKSVEFTRAWGVKSDVVLNKKETWAQHKYKIDNSTGEYIFLGAEVVTTDWSYGQYLTWAKKTRDSIVKYYGTTKKIICDQALLYKSNRKSLEWRTYITPTSFTGVYGADAYFQVDDLMRFTSNQDSNILKIRHYFDSIVPDQIVQFQQEWPGWKMIIGETLIEDTREGNIIYVNKAITGVYCWGRFYETFIKNQEVIPYAVQMSMKAVDVPTDNNTRIISLLNTLLNPNRKRSQVTFNGLEGCTGASVHEGKAHVILINNWSRNTYTLDQVQIDGKKKTPDFTAIHHTSATWNSEVVRDTVTTTTFQIKPGVTVLNFTLK